MEEGKINEVQHIFSWGYNYMHIRLFDSQSTGPAWVQSYVHVGCKPRESVDSKRVVLILDLVVSV